MVEQGEIELIKRQASEDKFDFERSAKGNPSDLEDLPEEGHT